MEAIKSIGIGLAVIGALVAAILVTFVACMAVVAPFEYYDCRVYENVTKRETVFKLPTSCYVKTASGFIPMSEFKARAITNER